MDIKKTSILSGIGILLLIFGIITFPTFLFYTFLLILPSYLFSYLFIKEEHITYLERILISLPLSGLFQLLLTVGNFFNLPVTKITGYSILFVLPIALIFLKKRKNLKGFFQNMRKEIDTQHLLSIGILFLITFVMWGSLLQDEKLPLSDQVNNHAHINEFYDELQTQNRILLSTPKLSEGITYVHELYFHYLRVALLTFLDGTHNLTHHQNGLAFFSLFFILLGMYAISIRFGFNRTESILIPLFFITNPFISSKLGYSGDIREMVTLAFFPGMILLIQHIIQKKGNFKEWILLGILAAVSAHSHVVDFAYAGVTLALFYFVYVLITDKKRLFDKNHTLGLFLFLGTVLILIASHFIGFASFYDERGEAGKIIQTLTISQAFKTFFVNDFLIKITSEPSKSDYSDFTGTIFFILGLIGFIFCYLRRKDEKNMLLFSFGVGFWIMIFFFTSIMLFFNTSELYFYRALMLFVFVWSFFIIAILRNMNHKKQVYVVLLLLSVLFLFYYGEASLELNKKWVSETAQNGLFGDAYKELYSRLGSGRVITYGTFSYGVEPAIPKNSEGNLWMVTHTITNSMDPQQDLKDGGENTLSPYPVEYILNRLRNTFTKYILVFTCDPSRGGAQTNEEFKNNVNVTTLVQIISTQCVSIYYLPSNFIESTNLIETILPEKQIYSFPGSSRGTGFADLKNYKTFPGKKIITKKDAEKLTQQKPYNYLFSNRDKIIIQGPFDKESWIVVKEHYYKRWHAFLDEKEIPVYRSNLNTILLHVDGGNRIVLEHSLLWYEKGGALLTIFFFLVILFYCIKKED